ncbi:IPT/TIG domain-containing protein [Cryptosporangium aurantiacum]|uniref:IPT/TIG domain-containing protein n=1 Tax=Cryptosporangium aurantiacum TaxID=134849 RepID=UPI0015B7C026|nr:IPT/TIG domain-containing protein [Cryptosporangium aurantiacum]
MKFPHRGRRTATTALVSAGVFGAGVLGAGVLGVAGSASAASTTTEVVAVTSLSTAYGSTAGGTNVVINGKGFNRLDERVAGSVMFGGKQAKSYLVLSDTQISAKAPAGTGSKVRVIVTDLTYTSADTTSDDFTYLEPISVRVPDKTELSAAGGTTVRVTLSGRNLDLSTAAKFTAAKITATVDGTAATIAWASATQATLTAPAGTPSMTHSKVPVVVSTNGVPGPADTTHARYAPVVTKLSVTSGKLAGTAGTSSKPALTITGVGLADADGFWFGKTKGTCTASSGKESTTWTCVNIPSAGVSGPVAVLPRFDDGRVAGVTAGSVYTYTNL